MKRIFLLSLLGAALSLQAGAQSFNHLSLGAGTGLDGSSFELAAPLGRHVQLRLGYGTAFGLGYTMQGNDGIRVPVHPVLPDGPEVSVPVKLSLARNDARLLFNIYPGARAAFHFTFGAYLGSGSCFKGVMYDLPEDYNTLGWDLGEHTVKAIDGRIRAELRAFGLGSPGFAVLPYAGIGFGRPVREDRRVTFSFDLGAAYQGQPTLWARSVKADGSRSFVDISDNEEIGFADLVKEYGQYMNFWPVINFHLFVRLF